MAQVPLHHLPLPSTTLQSSLPRLVLGDTPSAQRRSTTFSPSTPGIWARVNPLWAAWPLRITKAEVEEMGVDIEGGGQVSVEDVLARWDLVEEGEKGEKGENGLRVITSPHRLKLEAHLLGISGSTLVDSLPQLDVGDAVDLCSSTGTSSTRGHEAREMLVDLVSGRRVLAGDSQATNGVSNGHATSNGDAGTSYGPWSTRYCGHQFGSWAGQLGDGRATSILETESPSRGRQEIQVKGAGRTPFSRTADGLAVLRSGVREFLGCEAVAALGIPTTRSLALLTSDDVPVLRENGPEPSSLLARVAPSFIRIGHFQALNPGSAGRNNRQLFLGGGWMSEENGDSEGPLAGQGNLEGLRDLTGWCRDELMGMRGKGTAEWVREVVKRNAEMVAQWQVYGYCHGVLNTDNISVLGLTIDYGPYAFMDIWDEGHICNHSDPSGLYSYRNQPSRVLFALDKLVSALSPLIGYEANQSGIATSGWSENASKEDVRTWENKGEEAMKGWQEEFWRIEREGEREGWMKRFGLKTCQASDDRDIIYDLLILLRTNSMDFHTTFRKLCSFRPSRFGETTYLEGFAADVLAASTTALKADRRDAAIRGLVPWLEIYGKRGQLPAEADAWDTTEITTSEEDVRLYGEVVPGGWEEKRETMMKRTNPRFVLRQWVLEETIAELERTGVEGIQEGRGRLARILDMSTRPYLRWGEGSSEEQGEDARLCALGKREMLGFQCSCSS